MLQPKSIAQSLKSATALHGNGFNKSLLDALVNGDAQKENLVADVIKNQSGDARWEEIKKEQASLSMGELAGILLEMEKNGDGIASEKMSSKKRPSPMAQQEFYDALQKGILHAEELKKQMEELYAETKKQKNFFSTCFNIFSHKNPVEKALSSVVEFEKYTYKNGIKYDPSCKKLVAGEKPKTGWDKAWDNRFLLAAAGGAALGFAGINFALLPVLGLAPAAFFGALPWLAAPFIGLNIFKSFSQYSILKEAPTLLRFAAITGAGLAISLGVTLGMAALLPVVDPASIAAAVIPNMGSGGFSPMQYMLPIIGVFTGAALAYKRAKAVVAGEFNAQADKPGVTGKLSRVYNATVGLAMNKYTAPLAVKAGQLGEKATEFINKAFPKFIDIVGLPAIAVLLSATMATGGLGLMGAFAGYYATAFTGLAVGFAAMGLAFYKFGARGKDFKELASAAATGFSLSSSSATMPKEREVLKAMGVSAKTRDAVIPLGGVFNMYGTSLYMGLTAFYATTMFGASPSMLEYAKTAGTVMAIALGAPGIPASNITLLDPVLQQTGLATSQIHKVYAMVLPADRILDMTQTALNVLGDMIAAVHPDRKRLRYQRVKNIKKIREMRLEKEKMLKEQQSPANDNLPVVAAQPAPKHPAKKFG